MQKTNPGLLMSGLAIIKYANAPTAHTNSLIIKLLYIARTKTFGLSDFNELRVIKKAARLTRKRIRLPMIATSWSIPHRLSIFFPATRRPFIRTKTRIIVRRGLLRFIVFSFACFLYQLVKNSNQDEQR